MRKNGKNDGRAVFSVAYVMMERTDVIFAAPVGAAPNILVSEDSC